MPLKVLDAKLEFYNPASGALRTTLATNLRRFIISEQARDQADEASFDVAHDFADIDSLMPGDEVRAYVKTESDANLVHVWTGWLEDLDSHRESVAFSDVPIRAVDWVYGKMRDTYVTGVWENMTAGAIVRDVIADYAPTIGTANVANTATTLSTFIARDEQLLSVVRRLAEHANAEFRGDKSKNLHFFAKKSQSSGYNVTAAKVVRGSFHVTHSMAGFGNSQLVRGGSRHVIDQTGNAFDSFTTVTTSVRVKKRVFVSKSAVSQVEIWTDADTPSVLTGDLKVRIQADNADGTAPVEEANPDKDLAQRVVEDTALTNAGYTAFVMPDHVAPPGGFVWIIVEADIGSQRVGLDSGAALVHKTYFEVPIIVRREDNASVNAYGRRELPPITDTNIQQEADAETLADALVAAHKDPAKIGRYEISDMALVNVTLGQTVTADFPKDRISSGTVLVILEKRHVYDADKGTYSLVHAFSDNRRMLTTGEILKSFSQRIKRSEDAIWDTGIIALLGQVGETAIVADTATGTTQNAGTFLVGTAKVGFSTVG